MEIGDKIKTVDGKEITVKSFRNTENGIIVVAEDGNIYTDDELDLVYSVTPKGLLWIAMEDNGYDVSDEEQFCEMWDEFESMLVKLGYLKKE